MMSNKVSNNRIIFLGLMVCLLLLLAFIYWYFKPEGQKQQNHLNQQTQLQSKNDLSNEIQNNQNSLSLKIRGATIENR